MTSLNLKKIMTGKLIIIRKMLLENTFSTLTQFEIKKKLPTKLQEKKKRFGLKIQET